MKLCVLFPGVGYTVDKPLLYYTGKMFQKEGYTLLQMKYHDLPEKIRGDREKMELTFRIAMKQVEARLVDVDFREYEDVVFVGKSIGTVLAAAYARTHGRSQVRFIYMTPLQDTFIYAPPKNGLAFHGTADPWAETPVIREACERLSIPLYTYSDANHSLETGDVMTDIRAAEDVLTKIRDMFFGEDQTKRL